MRLKLNAFIFYCTGQNDVRIFLYLAFSSNGKMWILKQEYLNLSQDWPKEVCFLFVRSFSGKVIFDKQPWKKIEKKLCQKLAHCFVLSD